MAGRAEPTRGLAGAGPGNRGRRRPGPPPAPPTLAQRAAAASPLRMSRKGPRAEVCADCSAPGKQGLAGGGTAYGGRRPAGAGAWRERRAGPEGGVGLGAAASRLRPRPPPGPLRSRVLGRRAGLGAPCSRASADERGRTFPAPPPTPQSEGGGQLAAPPHLDIQTEAPAWGGRRAVAEAGRV